MCEPECERLNQFYIIRGSELNLWRLFEIIIHSIASTERVQFVYNDVEGTFWDIRNTDIFFDICENNSCVVTFQALF